jgi:hypothetical protein
MTSDVILNFAIGLLGVYATLLGFHVIGGHERGDLWDRSQGKVFRFAGPIMIAAGFIQFIAALLQLKP